MERNKENQARPDQHAQTGGRVGLSQAANPLDRDLKYSTCKHTI